MSFDADVAERIRAIVHTRLGVGEKKMFGGLAFLINGNMAVAASSMGGLMLRVDRDEADRLLTYPAARPMEMRGNPVSGWLRVDTDGMDDAEFARWVGVGVDYAESLPPK